jgi:hypothetical protein
LPYCLTTQIDADTGTLNVVQEVPDMDTIVETDGRSRLTLPGGKANKLYLVDECEDGTIVLRPATVITEAQAALMRNPELQQEIRHALEGPIERRPRRRRTRREDAAVS